VKPDWWGAYERLKPRIAEALGDDGYDLDWLEPRLFAGHTKLWLGEQSALIVEIDAVTIAAAGNGQELIETLRPQAEAWGSAVGLSQVLLDGRKGWARKLGPHGYVQRNAGLRKELN
jgi:hypothetical protein